MVAATAVPALAEGPAMCAGQTATITGTAQKDFLHGTAGRDLIAAGAGDDTVYASRGNDLVCGDAGADRLFAGHGNDLLFGGAGQDQLYGRPGNDRLYGGIVDGQSATDDAQQDLEYPGLGWDVCRLDPDDAAYDCEVSVGETH
jgi:Ca2+-binding RTX toxin-like protein